MVEVVGGRLNSLVGNRGATLEALQELSRRHLSADRRAVPASARRRGFRAARRKELVAVAKNAAEKVKQHGEAAAGTDERVRAQVRARRHQLNHRRGE
jgi:spoIIIJ-associated protein